MPIRCSSILPRIAVCGLLLTAACARGSAPRGEAVVADSSGAVERPQARDTVEVRALLRSLSYELRIETTGPRERGEPENQTTIQVGDRTLLVDSSYVSVEVYGWWQRPEMMVPEGRTPAAPLGSIALLRVMSGGSGCPAYFRVVELLDDGRSVITEEFGTCTEWPDAVWFDAGGAMRMRFVDFPSPAVRSEPGFREDPPTTWVYRTGGRLEEMKGR